MNVENYIFCFFCFLIFLFPFQLFFPLLLRKKINWIRQKNKFSIVFTDMMKREDGFYS